MTEWILSSTVLMTLRPADGGWQIVSNEFCYRSTLGLPSTWRSQEDITVYPFTDYAMTSALNAVQTELEKMAMEDGTLRFTVEQISFVPGTVAVYQANDSVNNLWIYARDPETGEIRYLAR